MNARQSQSIQLYLDLIAARARAAAAELRNGKLWPGDIEKALAEIRKSLESAEQEARYAG